MSALSADKVLVTVGTPCSISAVGTTETYQALATGSSEFIVFAAFDAGLIEFDEATLSSATPKLRWSRGEHAGERATPAEIEAVYGAALRASVGIRSVAEHLPEAVAATDVAACLPHDLESGGLRRLAGTACQDLRNSSLRDMQALFDDDPQRAPSLQSQLFVYAALGALAGLPQPLAGLLPNPASFRVAAATAFGGMDALARWTPVSGRPSARITDKLAMRLASSLASHGPALVATMLAPSYGLSRAMKDPQLLRTLRSLEHPGYMRVPQAPLVSVGACASSAMALCEIAPQMLFDYPGYHRPQVILWTAADAALQPDFGVLRAFGPAALTSSTVLGELNAARPSSERRVLTECLAPFDIDASGTVVGNAGSGVLVTTLDFALRNFLDVTSLIVGWGQSAEAGGKGHFAGVGFGGENAIVRAMDMAFQGHGYTVADFGYLVAHATGTRTNSRTELKTTAAALAAVAQRQKFAGKLPTMLVGAPKAVGDGHSMGETGLKAVSQAIQFVLGKSVPAIATLRRVDPEIGSAADLFVLQSAPGRGNPDGGALCATQGFGGYNGAIALRSANPDALRRYSCDERVLREYLERWPSLRQQRESQERAWRRRPRLALELAQLHSWPGME